MELILLKIWAGFLLATVAGAMLWIFKHQAQVRRKIIENNAMPRDAVQGNVLVLILAAGAAIIGVLARLLFV